MRQLEQDGLAQCGLAHDGVAGWSGRASTLALLKNALVTLEVHRGLEAVIHI
jgi:hypothetical protein